MRIFQKIPLPDRDGWAVTKCVYVTVEGRFVEAELSERDGVVHIDFSVGIGCQMSCQICKSKDVPLVRHLTAEEIAAQWLAIIRQFPSVRWASRIICRSFGEGEPFTNLRNVREAIDLLIAELGMLNIQFIVSTTGVRTDLIEAFGHFCGTRPVELQFSIHVADNETRGDMIPGTPPLERILPSLRAYHKVSGKPVVCNVVLCDGINDGVSDALRMADFLADSSWEKLVRFGTLNEISTFHGKPAPETSVEMFERVLASRGIRTERHLTRACGMLSTQVSVVA